MNAQFVFAHGVLGVPDEKLRHQSLGRPLTPEEIALANALESIYVKNVSDFSAVAAELSATGVKVPSDGTTTWSEDILGRELTAINRSLDEAYAQNGSGA